MEKNLKNNKSSLVTLACAVTILINNGIGMAYSVCLTNFMEEFSLSATQASLGPTAASLGAFACTALVAALIKKIAPKWLLMGSSILLILSGAVHYFCSGLDMLILGSVLNGLVLGFGTFAVISAILELVHGNNFSSVLGVIFAVAAFGGTFSSAIFAAFLGSAGWRMGYLAYGCGGGVVTLLLNLLLIPVIKKEDKTENTTEQSSVQLEGILRSEAIRTPSFWMALIGVMLSAVSIICFMNFVTRYWTANGIEPAKAALMMTVFTLIGAGYTFASGFIIQKLGTKVYLIVGYGLFSAGLIITFLWAGKPALWLAFLGVIFAAANRMLSGVSQMVVPAVFGRKDYAAISSTFMTGNYFAAIVGSLLVGAIYDATGSARAGFLIGAIGCVICAVLFITAITISPVNKKGNN